MKGQFCILFFLFSIPLAAQRFDVNAVLDHRQRQNADFADSLKSPLTAVDIKAFKSLDFFEPDSSYHVVARLTRLRDQQPFGMKTTTQRVPMYKKYGELHFELHGKKLKLYVYQNLDLISRPGFRDYLFIPFSDLTSGNQTYIGGRYLDAKIPEGDTMILDFNLAYNPYCAYNPKYSCPIVPLENDLPIEITAGVKKFHD